MKKFKSGCLTVIIIVVVIGFISNLFGSNKEDSSKTKTDTSKTEKIANSSKTETKKQETKKQETKKQETEKQETKNDGKEFTKESNKEFTNYLLQHLNDTLKDSGTQVRAEYYDTGLVYIYVPQENKYLPNNEIQQLCDTLLAAKNKFFKDWAIENGYDLGHTNAPVLTVKTDDNTVIGEESAWSGTMKRKIDN